MKVMSNASVEIFLSFVLPCSYAYVASETRLYLYMTEENGHRKIGQNIIIKCNYCSGNIRI